MYGELLGDLTKEMMKSISASCINYLLYGRCTISPEMSWEYIEWLSKEYKEPDQKYAVIFGIDPFDENNITKVAGIIAKGLNDNQEKFIIIARHIRKIMIRVTNEYRSKGADIWLLPKTPQK